jgi:hypothetical protein
MFGKAKVTPGERDTKKSGQGGSTFDDGVLLPGLCSAIPRHLGANIWRNSSACYESGKYRHRLIPGVPSGRHILYPFVTCKLELTEATRITPVILLLSNSTLTKLESGAPKEARSKIGFFGACQNRLFHKNPKSISRHQV